VTIEAKNDLPPVVEDKFTIAEDSGQQSFDVLANDRAATNPDDGETLKIVSVSITSGNGTTVVSSDGERVLYTPAANFVGEETFSYTITDGKGGQSTANVTVTVTSVEDPPDAKNDTFDVQRNSMANTFNVLANDTDPDAGDAFTITDVNDDSVEGKIEIAADKKSVSYTPAQGFFGQETFQYTITDSKGNVDTATVTVNVIGPMIGSLSGFVYIDMDNDAVKDEAERGLAGVRIRLWGKNVDGEAVNREVTTDANGAYRFDDVVAGGYVIEQVQPAEFRDGQESVGTAGGTAGNTAGVDQFFLAYDGKNGVNYNFAERGLKPEFIGRPNFFVP
jgi:hypothetical protein